MKVLSFVNGASSTSFEFEISERIHQLTDAHVEVASFYLNSIEDTDPDIANSELKTHTFGSSSRFSVNGYCKLRKLINEFDILHTHFNFVGSMGRVASLGKEITIVNTEHNDHNYFTHTQNLTNALSYPLVDVMVFNSNSTRKSLQKYELPLLRSTRCETIYNGINLNLIRTAQDREDTPDLPNGLKIITAAVIDEQKNLTTLVKAMKDVLNDIPDANLIIIGDGPKKETLEQMVKDMKIEDSVLFLGYLPKREQVYATMQMCDIFAVPSYYEGFCNAAVEAMCCGLPVVASDIDVLNEVVGEGGRFADPHNYHDVSEKLLFLLNEEEVRRDVAKKAKARAERKFGIDRCAKEYYNLYSSIVVD